MNIYKNIYFFYMAYNFYLFFDIFLIINKSKLNKLNPIKANFKKVQMGTG
jgi:hypothetical protein